jgi:hypothetical protein
MRHINFGSIDQFRQIVKTVIHRARYTGENDEEGRPILDKSVKLPTVTFTASEKIHGTNAAVSYGRGTFWAQSRNNVITPEKDNAKCAAFIHDNREAFERIINALATEYDIDLNDNIITLYFEWCGGNIQKKAAVSGLDTRAIIFQHFKVSPADRPEDEDVAARWFETYVGEFSWVCDESREIYNIMNYPVFKFEINFENPAQVQNEMIELVGRIEENSPVGKAMGVDGNVGEGIVCTAMYKDKLFRFKVKGEKHSASKVKTLDPVDVAKEQSKIDFANYATPAWRLEQAWQATFGINNEIAEPSVKATGDFLRAVIKDVMKEETDVMDERGLEHTECNRQISTIARIWFMEQLDKEAGLAA